MTETKQNTTMPLHIHSHRTGLQVRSVSNAKDWEAFHALPAAIYENDMQWVPPLRHEQKKLFSSRNPFFRKARCCAWLVFDGSTAVGRIVAYVDDAYNAFHGEKTGFFGFFECRQDKAAAALLIQAAQQWVKDQGMEKIRGPINFDSGNECGVLLKGHRFPPYLQMAHTPAYYQTLLEEASFCKAHDLLAFRIDLQKTGKNKAFMQRLGAIAQRAAQKEAWRIRTFSNHHFQQEIEKVHYAYNHWMQENWGFSPVSIEEVQFSAASLKSILQPSLVFFAEKGEALLGCCISLPDVNQVLHRLNGNLFPFGLFRFLYYRRRINRARLMLLAVSPDCRNKGMDIFFYYHAIRQAIALGYREAELSWVSEDNKVLISILKKFDAECYKEYRVFEKPL